MNKLKESLKFYKNIHNKLVLITIMYIIIGFLSFLIPILTANLLTGLIYTDIIIVFKYAIYVAMAFIIQEFMIYITEHIWNISIRPKILRNIREHIIKNILSLKISVIEKYGDGAIEEKIDTEPSEIAKIVNIFQRNTINVITKIGIIIYIIMTDWRISLIYIFGMICVAYIDTKKHNDIRLKDLKVNNSISSTSKYIDEVVEAMRDIKTLNIEEKIGSNLSEKLNTVAKKISEKDMLESKYLKIEKIILYITTSLVMIVGIIFFENRMLTIVNLLVMYLYQNDVFSLMGEISILRNSIKDYNILINSVLKLEDNKKYSKEKYGNIELKNIKGKIRFENITFRYEKNKDILNDMSFTIEAGETVALVSKAESGKSTICNLLLRNYNPSSGNIYIDDISIDQLTENTIKQNISIVNQDSYIFNMSIKDNLLIVKPNATKKQIDNVCKKAQIYDFIMSLPEKYNTNIGPDGVKLSGSQKQKLALARAFLQGSKILILDEATSMIDNESQAEIYKAIEEMTTDITVIMISHRLSAISKCDKIMIIDKGKIIAQGTHKNLITNCQVYKNIYKDVNKKIRF